MHFTKEEEKQIKECLVKINDFVSKLRFKDDFYVNEYDIQLSLISHITKDTELRISSNSGYGTYSLQDYINSNDIGALCLYRAFTLIENWGFFKDMILCEIEKQKSQYDHKTKVLNSFEI